MLTEYLDKKLTSARYKRLKDGSYFGEVPSARGVWANARTLPRCKAELREVLEDWLVLKVRNKEQVPGLKLHTDRRSLVK